MNRFRMRKKTSELLFDIKMVLRKLGTLTHPVSEKWKNSIFEMPIIPQTLNINNLRTTNAKPINLRTIRKLIKYSLKTLLQRRNVCSNRFRDTAVCR